VSTEKSADLELTPAASERLDQNVELVRQQLLREMSRQHSGSGYRVRASDVDSALNEIGIVGTSMRTVRSVAWLAAGIAAAGLITALIGQVSKPRVLWPLVGAALAAGVASGTTLAIIGLETMRRRLNLSRSSRQFVNTFDALESAMRQQSQRLMGAAAESASLGRVISAVELLQLWTWEDSREFRRLLAVRNAIVHEDSRTVSAPRLSTGSEQMARLSDLLTAHDSGGSGRIRDIANHRTARAFTDRVASALREAGVDVIPTHGDVYYDLLARSAGIARRIVIKYRRSGLLSVDDINDVVEEPDEDTETWIVTNVAVSPYAEEYVQLAHDSSGRRRKITIVSWADDYPATLFRALCGPSKS
jgi:hypothetical protein